MLTGANLVNAWETSENLNQDGSNNVTGWTDYQGNVNFATIGGTPSVNSGGGPNGTDSILFNGTSDYMRANFADLNQPSHVFYVVKLVSGVNGRTILEGHTVNRLRLYQTDATGTIQQFSGSAGGSVVMSIGTWHLIRAFYDGANSKIALNGGAYILDGTGTPLASAVTLAANGSLSSFANIEVAALALYNSEVSGATETALLDSINAKYAIF